MERLAFLGKVEEKSFAVNGGKSVLRERSDLEMTLLRDGVRRQSATLWWIWCAIVFFIDSINLSPFITLLLKL